MRDLCDRMHMISRTFFGTHVVERLGDYLREGKTKGVAKLCDQAYQFIENHQNPFSSMTLGDSYLFNQFLSGYFEKPEQIEQIKKDLKQIEKLEKIPEEPIQRVREFFLGFAEHSLVNTDKYQRFPPNFLSHISRKRRVI